MRKQDRELGMGREISRRDFLNGVSAAAAGSLLPGEKLLHCVAGQIREDCERMLGICGARLDRSEYIIRWTRLIPRAMQLSTSGAAQDRRDLIGVNDSRHVE